MAETRDWLRRSDEIDAEEDGRYRANRRRDEIPEQLRSREVRLAIRAAKARLEATL